MEEITEAPKPPKGTVSAFPTKRFFMSMLTRDIALDDAIMDLLDNCIDGVHRKIKGNEHKQKPYEGYRCNIDLREDAVIISDNCGGIPLDVAINYAFKMGRSDEYVEDVDIETVGMYGIGMKRAIFKMGEEAMVVSHHDKDKFIVHIPENWLTEKGWNFKYTKDEDEVKEILSTNGTFIKISKLHKAIAEQLKDGSDFINKFIKSIRSHYGYIIDQGFRIEINGVKIEPLELRLLTSNVKSEKAIKPYAYVTNIDGVDVEVLIGFYRKPATEKEISDELEGSIAKSSSENAGITVTCNDRVVLYCDKTLLTGWGDPPVPKYHTQFIAIAGVVHFRSKEPIKLPVTTTKRGLDTSSRIYAEVRIRIREGLKIFTSFTNDWKKPSEERDEIFANTTSFNALRPGHTKTDVVKMVERKTDKEGLYQIPTLPKPDDEKRERIVRISFEKDKNDVQKMNEYYFEGKASSAAVIGSWCFDRLYSQID